MASYFSKGKNHIMCKPLDIMVWNKAVRSQTLAEAFDKQLKFYRDTCRRKPFIVQSSYIMHNGHPTRARFNLAKYLRRNLYLRNVSVIDVVTTDMY